MGRSFFLLTVAGNRHLVNINNLSMLCTVLRADLADAPTAGVLYCQEEGFKRVSA